MSATRPRRLASERHLTRQAGFGHDPDRIIVAAEQRAHALAGEYVPDPMQVTLERDRPQEAGEELVDARNHLVWWLEDNPDHRLYAQRFEALRLVIQAYALLGPSPPEPTRAEQGSALARRRSQDTLSDPSPTLLTNPPRRT